MQVTFAAAPNGERLATTGASVLSPHLLCLLPRNAAGRMRAPSVAVAGAVASAARATVHAAAKPSAWLRRDSGSKTGARFCKDENYVAPR